MTRWVVVRVLYRAMTRWIAVRVLYRAMTRWVDLSPGCYIGR